MAVTEDISERKRLEEELRQAQAEANRNLALFKAVYEHANQALLLVDGQGRLLDWNPAGLTMHGYEDVEEVRAQAESFTANYRLADLSGQVLSFDQWPVSLLIHGRSFVERIQIGRAHV